MKFPLFTNEIPHGLQKFYRQNDQLDIKVKGFKWQKIHFRNKNDNSPILQGCSLDLFGQRVNSILLHCAQFFGKTNLSLIQE